MALAEIQKRGSAMRSLRYGLVGVWTCVLRFFMPTTCASKASRPQSFATKRVGFFGGGKTRSASWVLHFPAFAFACARVAVSVAGVRQMRCAVLCCNVVRRGIGVCIHTSRQSRRSIIQVSSDQIVRGLAAQAHYYSWYTCCLYTGRMGK